MNTWTRRMTLGLLIIASLALPVFADEPTLPFTVTVSEEKIENAVRQTESTNLIPDSSFENGTNWIYGTLSRSTEQHHSGSYSLKSTGNGVYATTTFKVIPNTLYKLSGWISKTASTGDAYLDMNGITGQTQIGYFGTANGGWTQMSDTWYSASSTSVTIRCGTDNGNSAAVYFDDVSLIQYGTGSTIPLTRSPKLVVTNFASEDAVISDYDVTDYGADKTGTADCTSIIQQVLDLCHAEGGGTVWMPAGTYKVSGAIYVRDNSTLRGDWRDPDSGAGSYGTVLLANVTTDIGGLVIINSGSAAIGLTVYYPHQSATKPVDLGWAFLGTNQNCVRLSNITLLNSYKGIGLCPPPYNGNMTAQVQCENIRGTVLYRGLVVYNGGGGNSFDNIQFSNSYWANAGIGYNAPSKSTLDSWSRANGTAFEIGDLECSQFSRITVTDYKCGINIVAGTRVGFWGGGFVFCSITNTDIAMKIDRYLRMNGAVRCEFKGSILAVEMNDIGYKFGGLDGTNFLFSDCSLSGGVGGSKSSQAIITNPGTSPTSYTENSINHKPTRNVIYDVTKSPYNAPFVYVNTLGLKLNPTQDATSAIQSALNDAGTAGGGVVYLPAGYYKIGTHLSVPANVELRGSTFKQYYGTTLWAYEGENTGSPKTDTACITLNGNGAGASGFLIIYPNNSFSGDASTLKTFPYGIRVNGVSNAYVKNVGFPNSYLGVDVANGSDGHYIKGLLGIAAKEFVTVGTCTEGWIETFCDTNPGGWTGIKDAFGISTTPWMTDINYALMPYNIAYSTMITINGASNEHIRNVGQCMAKNALYVTSGTVDAWNIWSDSAEKTYSQYCVNAVGGNVKVMNSIKTTWSYDTCNFGCSVSINEMTQQSIHALPPVIPDPIAALSILPITKAVDCFSLNFDTVLDDIMRQRIHVIIIAERGGAVISAVATTPKWNSVSHSIDTSLLQLSPDKITGTLKLRLHGDGWVPKDGADIDCTIPLQVLLNVDGTGSATTSSLVNGTKWNSAVGVRRQIFAIPSNDQQKRMVTLKIPLVIPSGEIWKRKVTLELSCQGNTITKITAMSPLWTAPIAIEPTAITLTDIKATGRFSLPVSKTQSIQCVLSAEIAGNTVGGTLSVASENGQESTARRVLGFVNGKP